jgi:hypothetical protein
MALALNRNSYGAFMFGATPPFATGFAAQVKLISLDYPGQG